METKYIAFDAETGGLIPKEVSLLTMDFGVYNSKLEQTAELPLWVKPNDNKPYAVTAEALSVNKIDLIEHDKIAISESEAGQRLYQFLKQESDNGKIKLVPIGQQVVFDLQVIWAHLINQKGWEYFCSYIQLDTATIGRFLKMLGLMPFSVGGSLTSYAKFYNIPWPGSAHTARADRIMTVEVLKAMLKQVESLKQQGIQVPTLSK